MAPYYSIAIEAALDTDEGSFNIRSFDSDTFDVVENALDLNAMASQGLSLKYGIEGNGPLDRVASTGTLSFTLRNDALATEGQGCFSPGHPNVCEGWTFGIRTQVIFTFLGINYIKFFGKIDTIDPDAGMYSSKKVHVVAYDYIKDLVESDVREIATQIDKTEAELIDLILDSLPDESQPSIRDIDTGIDTFPIALDNLGEGVPALTVIQDLAVSSLGYVFIKGDGTFCYRTRHSNTIGVSQFSFDNNMHELVVPSSLENTFNLVRIDIHPRSVSASPIEELYSLPFESSITLESLEVRELEVQYTDPNDRETSVGGLEIVTQLVPGVHYKASTVKDGHSFGTNNSTGTTVIGVNPIGTTVIAVTSVAPVSTDIVSNSIANPSIVTTTGAHGLTTGQSVTISSVVGSSPTINGQRIITVLSPTTFSIPVSVTVAGTGGRVTKSTGSFLSRDIISIGGNTYTVVSTVGGQTPTSITIEEPGLIAATTVGQLVTLSAVGVDITDDITAVLTPYSSNAKFLLTNTGGSTAYIILLKVIGKAIRDPGPQTVISADIHPPGTDTRRVRPLDIDLPYQDDINVAQSAADTICQIYELTEGQVSSISFLAITNDLMIQALEREPGDKITITEEMTGLISVIGLIQSVSLDIQSNNVLVCTWGLSPTSSSEVWLWGIAGQSEWGETTYYGF